MSLELFPHQEDGVSWMISRENCEKCPGGLLLDDCGVGKTPQVIATLAKNPQKLTLIVAPVNILSQWVAQLHRWVPEFKVILYHSSGLVKTMRKVVQNQTKRAQKALKAKVTPPGDHDVRKKEQDDCELAAEISEIIYQELYRRAKTANTERHISEYEASVPNVPLVVVTSYGKLTDNKYERRRAKYKRLGLLSTAERFHTGTTPLSCLHWDRVVLDECHLIRNHNTTRTRYVLALKSRIRWGLTATPIHNGMKDYECLLRFLGLKKWEIAHVFASHPALEKYLTDKARKEAEGKILDFSEGGLDGAGKIRILSKKNPLLRHEEITLRRTKKQVFSQPRDRPSLDLPPLDLARPKSPETKSRNGKRSRRQAEKDDEEEVRKKLKTSGRAPELPDMTLDIVRVDFATREEEAFYRRLERTAQLEVFPQQIRHADHHQDDEEIIPEITDQALFELILRLRQASVNPAMVISGYRRKFQGQFPANLLPPTADMDEEQDEIDQGAVVDGRRLTRAEKRRLRDERREYMMVKAIGVPSKTRVLQKMILEHRREEKAIIFCEFREEMPYLQEDLQAVGISSVLYDGSLSLAARAEIVKRMSWINSEIEQLLEGGQFFPGVTHVPNEIVGLISRYVSYDVILVQINSGNAGLNLQMCSRVYYTNPNWNPCTEIQAWGRAHRLGQTVKVAVVKLALSGKYCEDSGFPTFIDDDAAESTVDQRVLEVQMAKRKVMADILDDEDILFNGNDSGITASNITSDSPAENTGTGLFLTREDMLHIVG